MSQVQAENKQKSSGKLAALWLKEDWWAVWLGILLIGATLIGWLGAPTLPARWGREGGFDVLTSISSQNIVGILITGVISWVIFSLAVAFFKRDQLKRFVVGFPVLYGLAILAYFIGNFNPIRHYGFNNVIWALGIGLLISNLGKIPEVLKNALFTELYIKTGLVLLGASILFDRVLALGLRGLGVAWIVTPLVLLISYYYSQKVLKLERGLAITISSALSVCGVSAAIATGAAAKAKKEDISLAISISLIFTILLMILLPLFIGFLGLSPAVGGAWIGGTIDATGAVVAASTILGQEALEVASVIKMIQNVLIGIIAFAVAAIWSSVYEKESGEQSKISLKEIWIRLPKFILGFFGASLVFSFIVPGDLVSPSLSVLDNYRELFFTLAFVSIGLESNFKNLANLVKGGRPVHLYLFGQGINLVITLAAAVVFFG